MGTNDDTVAPLAPTWWITPAIVEVAAANSAATPTCTHLDPAIANLQHSVVSRIVDPAVAMPASSRSGRQLVLTVRSPGPGVHPSNDGNDD
jgi:hypothetical protein